MPETAQEGGSLESGRIWGCLRKSLFDCGGDGKGLSNAGKLGAGLTEGVEFDALSLDSKNALFSLNELLLCSPILQICSGNGFKQEVGDNCCSNCFDTGDEGTLQG